MRGPRELDDVGLQGLRLFDQILDGAEPTGEEIVALDAAFHRTLARDVAAKRTQPPQAMSAMDGYAVRAADAADLSAQLKVIGEVAAGQVMVGAMVSITTTVWLQLAELPQSSVAVQVREMIFVPAQPLAMSSL